MKIKALALAMMLFGMLCASVVFVPNVAEAKCIYCGSNNTGDCGKAPSSDKSNPKRKHKHEANGKNCVWCQQVGALQSCSHSPDGKHQLK